MSKVFISYKSINRPIVEKIAASLRHASHDVWLDQWRITGREPYWDEIERGIKESDYFIFAISPAAIDKDPTNGARKELFFVSGLKKPPIIIPIMVEATDFDELPINISPGAYQIHDFVRRPYDEAIKAVMIALDKAVDLPVTKTTVEPDPYQKDSQAIETVRQKRLDNIKAGETPVPLNGSACMVLQLFPFSVLNARQTFQVTTLESKGNPTEIRALKEATGCYKPSIKPTGMVYFPGFEQSLDKEKAYVLLSKNGSIEYVDSSYLSRELEGQPCIPSEYYESKILSALPHMLNILQNLGVKLPIAVGITLINVKGYILGVSERFWMINGSTPIQENELVMPLEILDTATPNFDQLMKPIFDTIWNACNWPGSMNYDETGKWIGQPR